MENHSKALKSHCILQFSVPFNTVDGNVALCLYLVQHMQAERFYTPI